MLLETTDIQVSANSLAECRRGSDRNRPSNIPTGAWRRQILWRGGWRLILAIAIFVFTRGAANPYAVMAMWYVNKLFDQPIVESLSAKGFLVRNSGGVVRIEKYNCGAELRKTPESRFQMTEIPCVMMQGQFTSLWDAGYQKFLIGHEGKKFPVQVHQLGDLRRFNEELRTALGVPTYYNEALGSTCAFSVYDRVKGRPGDVPDESVGAQEDVEH